MLYKRYANFQDRCAGNREIVEEIISQDLQQVDVFSQEATDEITEQIHEMFPAENLLVYDLHENTFGADIKKTIISSEIGPQ